MSGSTFTEVGVVLFLSVASAMLAAPWIEPGSLPVHQIDYFGWDAALDGDRVVVSAPAAYAAAGVQSGTASIFDLDLTDADHDGVIDICQ